MGDYLVGKKSGGKDRYVVGWQDGKNPAYKVGGGKGSVASANNSELGGGDQASPAGQKSAFSYKGVDHSNKNDGSDSENMGFGGAVSSGMPSGNMTMEYSEKGDWDMGKNAMAKRKAMLEAANKYLNNDDKYKSPTVDIVDVKKI